MLQGRAWQEADSSSFRGISPHGGATYVDDVTGVDITGAGSRNTELEILKRLRGGSNSLASFSRRLITF